MITRVVVVTGPVGAGKTSVARRVCEVMDDRPRTLCVDMDALREVSGHSASDPFWTSVGLAGLAAMADRAGACGATVAVLADVVEHPSQRHDYAAAVPGAEVTIVRLDVPLPLVEQRLRTRMADDDGLAWHLTRAPELQGLMTAAGVGDVVLDVGSQSVDEVASELVDRLGLRSTG